MCFPSDGENSESKNPIYDWSGSKIGSTVFSAKKRPPAEVNATEQTRWLALSASTLIYQICISAGISTFLLP
jgi:hypothetical protein